MEEQHENLSPELRNALRHHVTHQQLSSYKKKQLGIPSMDIMAEAAKRLKKTLSEEEEKGERLSERPDSKSQTFFYWLARAKRDKMMQDKC